MYRQRMKGINMVQELLRKGKENATTSKELINVLGLMDARELKSIVQSERQNGAVILSTTGNNGGYYLPGNVMELKEFIITMESRKKELEKSTASAIQLLKGYVNECAELL